MALQTVKSLQVNYLQVYIFGNKAPAIFSLRCSEYESPNLHQFSFQKYCTLVIIASILKSVSNSRRFRELFKDDLDASSCDKTFNLRRAACQFSLNYLSHFRAASRLWRNLTVMKKLVVKEVRVLISFPHCHLIGYLPSLSTSGFWDGAYKPCRC